MIYHIRMNLVDMTTNSDKKTYFQDIKYSNFTEKY